MTDNLVLRYVRPALNGCQANEASNPSPNEAGRGMVLCLGAGVAVETAHRYDSLREIAETVASTPDLDTVLEKVVESQRSPATPQIHDLAQVPCYQHPWAGCKFHAQCRA